MVQIHLTPDCGWIADDRGGYVKGWAYTPQGLLRGAELLDCLRRAALAGNMGVVLSSLGGEFAAVVQDGTGAWLVSDRMRSYPLLYARSGDGGAWVVCGNGIDMARSMPSHRLDESMLPTFLALGHLWGADTLYEGCRIVPPSTCVRLTRDGEEVLEYGGNCRPSFDGDAGQLFDRSAATLEDVFSHIARLAVGRTLAIPLSGGYDSRLVACLCKAAGLERVVCYTYGKAGNPEVEVSRQVARKLGFRWTYVECTEALWRGLLDGGTLEEYLLRAGNLNAIGHIQDLPVVLRLTADGTLPPDAVVMPGHSGDFIGGSHFKPQCTSRRMMRMMYDKYYELNVLRPASKALAMTHLAAAMPDGLHDEEDCLEAWYVWCKRARQANFIINSVRAYEFAGLQWTLPLWDAAFVRLWESVPCTVRRGSALYEQFMFERYFEPMGVAWRKPRCAPSPLSRLASTLLSRDQRTIMKHLAARAGIAGRREGEYDMNIVGDLIRARYGLPDDIISRHVRLVRPGSMSAKALLYLALIR